MSFEPTTRKTRSGKMKLKKVADKSLKSNQPLKSSKLKGKRLQTFIKKRQLVLLSYIDGNILKIFLNQSRRLLLDRASSVINVLISNPF